MRRSLALALALALGCTASDPAPPVRPQATTSPEAATLDPASPAARSPAAMAWSRIADIPTPRSEVAATAFRGWIYVIGGFGGLRTVERYDPADGRWERQPDLPVGVDHPMAAAIDHGDRAGVYVFGGNTDGRATARAFRLAPDASSWREIAPMPAPRAAGAAVAVAELAHEAEARPLRIYIVGGAAGGRLEATTLEYEPARDAWRARAPIPTPRDHLAAARFEGVCAVGGRELSMSRNLAAFECYDPTSDTWQRLPAAPTARGGVGAAVVEKKLFFIGGEQPQGTFKEVEIYDADTRRWARGPDLPTARHGIGVVAFGRAVYVMTGGPRPGGSQTAVCEVLSVP